MKKIKYLEQKSQRSSHFFSFNLLFKNYFHLIVHLAHFTKQIISNIKVYKNLERKTYKPSKQRKTKPKKKKRNHMPCYNSVVIPR